MNIPGRGNRLDFTGGGVEDRNGRISWGGGGEKGLRERTGERQLELRSI